MLNIYFGNMEEAIYNPAVYFKNTYQDSWITNERSKAMIIKCLMPVSYTHLDVYKRQRVENLHLEMIYVN